MKYLTNLSHINHMLNNKSNRLFTYTLLTLPPSRVPRKDLSGSLQLIMSQICFYCLTAQKDLTFKSVASSTILCFAIFSYSPIKTITWPTCTKPFPLPTAHIWWNKPALLITLHTTKLTGVKSTGNHGTSRHKQLKPCKSYMKMKKKFSSASLFSSLPQHFTELQPECLCSRIQLAQTGPTAGCPTQQFCDKYLLFNPWMKLGACWIAWGQYFLLLKYSVENHSLTVITVLLHLKKLPQLHVALLKTDHFLLLHALTS